MARREGNGAETERGNIKKTSTEKKARLSPIWKDWKQEGKDEGEDPNDASGGRKLRNRHRLLELRREKRKGGKRNF